jgi:hypothetical protein
MWKKVLPILPIVLLIFIVGKFYVNIPFWDQWDFVPLLDKFYLGSLRFSDLWAQHGPHRIIIPKMVMLFLAVNSSWNIFYELIVNIILAIGIYLTIYFQVNKLFKKSESKYMLLFFISLIVFSLSQWENWLWGWQMQIFICVLACLLGLQLISTKQVSFYRYLSAVCAGFIATFSFFNGLLYWPIGWWILVKHYKPRVYKLIWFSISVFIFLAYFYGYQLDDVKGGGSIGLDLGLNYLLYPFAFLGAPLFSFSPPLAIITGLAGLVSIFLFVRKNGEKNIRNFPIFLVALMIFSFCSGILTSLGRAKLGLLQAISSRYITFGSLFWIALVVFLYWKRKEVKYAKIIMLLITGLVTVNSFYRIKTIIRQSNFLSEVRENILSGKPVNPEKIYHNPKMIEGRLETLKKYKLSLFAE